MAESAENRKNGIFQRGKSCLKRFYLRYSGPQDDREVDVLYGLRVVFILIISWYHIWQQSWLTPTPFGVSLDFLLRSGYEWVDAMLLLSGFLLFLPCTKGKKVEPGAFYKKRFARIVPSYYLCLFVLLFVVVLPEKKYSSAGQGIGDMLAHMTFVHNLNAYTYVGSPLNGVLWTLAVEAQFYLLFPFLSRAFQKSPLVTWCLMSLVAFAYRDWAATRQDTSLLINQLPAFMDVYANGFAAALFYRKMKEQLGEKRNLLLRLLFTAMSAVCVLAIIRIMKNQAASNGLDQLRLGQMQRRFAFTVLLSFVMIYLPFAIAPVRFLFGNRLMRFLSGITFPFYMFHQAVAVQLKKWHFPPYLSAEPHVSREQPWQLTFTLAVFGVTLLIAMIMTYLVEKPAAQLILREGKNGKGKGKWRCISEHEKREDRPSA